MADLVVQKNRKVPFWVQYIKGRIRKNKNFLGIIYGPTGSGKSWASLSIAEMINDDFHADRVVFKGKALLELINSKELPKSKGVVIIWDEAGIDLSSRNWQSVTNKMLNFLLQTFRHRCIILLFTVPYADFIDSNTRKLFHAEFKTISIDYHKKVVRLKPKLLQYNSEMGKFYKKFLRIATGHGAIPLSEWSVPAPTQSLIDAYEEKKTLFTNELNQIIERELIRVEGRQLKPLTELQQQILDCWSNGMLLQKDISIKLGKDPSQISRNEGFMLTKGYAKPKGDAHV